MLLFVVMMAASCSSEPLVTTYQARRSVNIGDHNYISKSLFIINAFKDKFF
jgi:hypothetical protein